MIKSVVYNKNWEDKPHRVSIITPVYNRRKELPRAIASIEAQTNQNFEHIIIDDGSKESVDDIVKEYMERAPYPVAFIKKENGGVHTARNAGIRITRGELYLPLDSDDELTPNCVEVLTKAWDSIPQNEREQYQEVECFCKDQDGVRIGGHLPSDINKLSWAEAKAANISATEGERYGMLRGDLMRENLLPEPEGVTFVMEGILWMQLGHRFKSWFVDDALRIYHRETEGSYSNEGQKKSNQQVLNSLYNYLWLINNGEMFGQRRKQTLQNIVRYTSLCHVLKWRNCVPKYQWMKEGIKNHSCRFLKNLLWIPAIIPAFVYCKRHPQK